MYKKINKNFLHFFAIIFLALVMLFCKINISNSDTKIYAETRPKVSVIVPVYKVEPYLRECMDSLVNQTLQEIEIIAVDDGSPDNCGRILDEYKQKYSSVKVIHQKNGGVSKARNAGLDVATGEYITFADSDDYLDTRAYEFMYKYAKKDDVDILHCNYRWFADGNDNNINKIDFSDAPSITTKDYIYNRDYKKYYVWNHFFKYEIIQNDKLRFISGLNWAEDTCFLSMALANSNKIKLIPAKFYNYRSRPNSLTSNTSHEQFFKCQALKKVCDDWRKRNCLKNKENQLITLIVQWLIRNAGFLDHAQETLDSFGSDILTPENVKKCPDYIQNHIKKLKFSAYCSKNPPLQDGIYCISSAVNKYTSCLDICGASKENCANLYLWEKNGTPAQKFEIKMQKGGYYTIKALCSDKMLDVKDASQKIGTNIQQYQNNYNQAQNWYIIPDFRHDGSFKIISVCNLLAMDVQDAKNKNGTNIRCWKINNSKAQKFKFVA